MLRHAHDIHGALISQLSSARRRTDELFDRVPEALLYSRPIPERHRIAFYLGHLEAFDANLLQLAPQSQPERALRQLFAFGIDPVGGQLPNEPVQQWPVIEPIREFVADTRQRLDRWLQPDAPAQVDGVALAELLHTAIEHRWMHAETLAYMLNRLELDKPVRALAAPVPRAAQEDMVLIAAGTATLGRARDDPGYGWDNEYGQQTVAVEAFQIDRYMVSNAQYLRFIDAGGYQQSQWWQSEDWQWRERHRIEHPASWLRRAGAWQLLSLTDTLAFQADWPVYVSHAEASAYARWSGKQLPSEAQWHRAAYGTPAGPERSYPWGEAAPSALHGNFNFERWDPMPVDAHPAGASAFGVHGLLGNGWEWTRTAFAAFPGFEPAAYYPGYSADFFDQRHFVQKGGCAHTALALLRRPFRNWFQPHYPYSFAGLRCVRQS